MIRLKTFFKIIKNIYFLTGVMFLVWVLFFDSNSFIQLSYMNAKLDNLKTQKKFYLTEIKKIQKDLKKLNSNPEELEKFAREKYLFKRKDEDIFLIEKKNN